MSDGSRLVKRLIPARLKRAVRESLRERAFSRAVRRVASLPAGRAPTREMLAELQEGWGNEGFAARTDYLEEVAARALETRGPVLECGSGLTSVLLGLLAGRRGVETWSLEHTAEWRERVARALEGNGLAGVHVCHAPLKDYGEFSWYDPPPEIAGEVFRLVICDGPPGTTDGGRYGLLPVLGRRLADGALILLDDADRDGEADVLKRWSGEAKLEAETRQTPTGAFALVRLG